MESEKKIRIKNFCFAFLKRRLYPLVFLVIAIIAWIIQSKLQDGDLIPPSQTWLRLISYFFLFLSPYIFLLKEKRYLLANLIIIGPILILFEGTCFYLLDCPDKIKKDFSLPLLEEGSFAQDLGIVPYQNSVMDDKKEVDGKLVFDVHYSIDDDFSRITPGFDSTRDEFALFFGCSIAFGYGLNDNETLPFYFQEFAHVNSKNLAFNSWGTNHMLARLQRGDFVKNIKEKKGTAYYIFFWDHIHRAIGTMDRYTDWVSTSPYFYMDGEEIKRDRSFKDGRYWVSKFYELVYQTSIVNYFEINFPNKFRDNHYDLISEMILESKKSYEKQFNNEEFYLVIYPSYIEYTEEQMETFKGFLDAKNIQYIDLNKVFTYGGDTQMDGDPHPRASFNKIVAEELYKQVMTLKAKK